MRGVLERVSTVGKIHSLLTPPERRGAVILLVLVFVAMLLETLGVGLVIPAVTMLTQSDLGTTYPELQPVLQALGNPSQQAIIIGGMLLLVSVYLIKALFMALIVWKRTGYTLAVRTRLSQHLFTLYLRQPYTFHLQHNSARLINQSLTEVDIFTSDGLSQAITVASELLILLGLCGLLLFVEPVGALILISVLGIAVWGSNRATRKHLARWGKERQHHGIARVQWLQQGLGGAKDVKLLGRETNFLDRFRYHMRKSARVERLHAFLQQLPRLWLEVLMVSGLTILVASMLAQGRALETVIPILALFAVATFRIMPSVNKVLVAVQALRFGLTVIDSLHKEISLSIPEPTNTRSPVAFRPFHRALELNEITYTYPSAGEPSLKEVSLVLKHGEALGIVGTSGAGKSTLVDILLGLLSPDSGEVRVDGRDIQENLRNWQDQIGYVPQSIFLTDDTLRRNVAFGLSDEQIDAAAVQRAIRDAQLEEFVGSLPDGQETIVGERGVRLSGGQRQRIGIARALYHAPTVLVLDEATSSLDIATEHGVMESVHALQGDKTLVIVAHRFSTVEHCDHLFRFDKGRVVDEGKTEAVLGRWNSDGVE